MTIDLVAMRGRWIYDKETVGPSLDFFVCLYVVDHNLNVKEDDSFAMPVMARLCYNIQVIVALILVFENKKILL